MATSLPPPAVTGLPERPAERRSLRARAQGSDAVFLRGTGAASTVAVVIMVAIGAFLAAKAWTALRSVKLAFLTTAQWTPDTHHFGIAAVMTGTVLIAAIAVVVSVPFAVGTSLFISEIASPRMRSYLVAAIDLMAAIPSVVYGLWGLFYLQGHLVGVARFINTWLGWIPLFRVNGADPTNPLSTASVYTSSAFIAGLVVSMMVMPIQCSIMREGFSQAPAGEREGAYALGATRWGMIRSVVLPFGRGAAIGGTMLGLGRALGETVAVYLIISPSFRVNFHVLQNGTNSVSSLIALRFGEASPFGLSALMAAGLSLFVLTLLVNFGASAIITRSRSGASSEA